MVLQIQQKKVCGQIGANDCSHQFRPISNSTKFKLCFNQNWNNENYDLTSYNLDENFAKELLEQIGSPDKEELLKRASQEDTIENDISKYLQDSPIYLDYNVGRVGLHPHQSKSFQQSIEKWPIRQLYADEVGLGKTIEMGSTISYLVKNHLVDSVLILAPKRL